MFRLFKRFGSSDTGSATVEFALLFPLFMGIFATGFESGLFMTRSVMLERSVDIAIRDVRLGGTDLPDLKGLKEEICENALVLPNCTSSLQIQLEPIPVTPGAIKAVNGPVRCVDKMSKADPSTGTNYGVGGENEMMIVKVCALVKPLFPASRLGLGLQADKDGNYALVAVSAFVNEPGQRSIKDPSTGGSTGGSGGISIGGET